MPVYHQMGHHSENLLHHPELSGFAGAILSPVNYTQTDVARQIEEAKKRVEFEVVFDPQLYYPQSERGCLPDWTYYPSDVETADMSQDSWWQSLTEAVASTATELAPHVACSPALVLGAFPNEYYTRTVRAGNAFAKQLAGTAIRPMQTLIVRLQELGTPARPREIASIVSRTEAHGVYLVIVTDVEPRRELDATEELKGVMRLISSIEGAGLPVTVGFSSTDMVLWKAAGATSCATGKFFNLRRFTRSRFDEPSGGGGQLPYWMEEATMGFLREADVLRLRDRGSLADASLCNPFGQAILTQFENHPGKPWVALGWRQFMWQFWSLEGRIADGTVDVDELLSDAQALWLRLEDDRFLMEEPRNTGFWIRPWQRAIRESTSS